MKSYMCKLHLGSFNTVYCLYVMHVVKETETLNLYMWKGVCFTDAIFSYFCERQEEPAILISRLVLHMRRVYVASIRLNFH